MKSENNKKSTHTPGPWRVGDAGQTVFGPPNGNPCPALIAQRILRHNSALIAAAPDLLAALEILLFRAQDAAHGGLVQNADKDGLDNIDALAKARAAINKAKGNK